MGHQGKVIGPAPQRSLLSVYEDYLIESLACFDLSPFVYDRLEKKVRSLMVLLK